MDHSPLSLKKFSLTKFIKYFKSFYAWILNLPSTTSLKKIKRASHALLENPRHAYSQFFSFREVQGVVLTLSTLSITSFIPFSVFTLSFSFLPVVWPESVKEWKVLHKWIGQCGAASPLYIYLSYNTTWHICLTWYKHKKQTTKYQTR